MKFAVIADLHLHNHREFGHTLNFRFGWSQEQSYVINSRLADQLTTLDDLFDRLWQRKIKHVFIAGDLFHVRGIVPTDVLQVSTQLFSHWVDMGMKFYALSGNHDQMDASGSLASTAAFYHLFNVVTRTPEVHEIHFNASGLHVYMVPWIEDRATYVERIQSIQPILNPGFKSVLISHAAIDGAEIGTMEYRLKEPIVVDDLQPSKFDAVFLGHFHKPQKMADNVWYVGSPYQITRAERDDVKRAMVYDSETGKVTVIKTNGPQFYMLDFQDIATGDVCLQHGYYDILVHKYKGQDKKWYQWDPVEIRARLADLNVRDFHLIHPREEASKKARLKLSKKATDRDILEAFLKAKGVEAPEDLLEAGIECLTGVDSHGNQAKEITFEHLKVRNFLSLRKVDLALHQPGSVIAVLGENLDATGMESNGSGKSSLLPESLAWCLYGTTIRDIPVDRVVNSTKKRNCFVKLTCLVDGKEVVVTRYRKHEEHGNVLSLIVDGVDQTQGTNALTQTRLDALLGMSMDAFNSVMAFSPDSLHFVSATDVSKKQILDSIIHTERYNQAAAIAKRLRSNALEDKQKAMGELAEASGKLEAKKEQLAEFQQLQIEETERLAELKKARIRKKKQINIDIDADNVSMGEIEVELTSVNKTITQIQAKIPNMLDLIEAKDKTAESLRTVEHQLVELGVKQGQCTTSITKLTKAAGRECPTCLQVISGQHVGKISAKLDRTIRELAAQIEPLTTEQRNLQEAVAKFTLDIRKAEENKRELEKAKKTRDGLVSQKSKLEQHISSLQASLESMDQTADYAPDYTEKIKDTQKAIKELQCVCKESKELAADMEAMETIYKNWVDWFGHKGIKSFLLDRIIPALTEYANEFAGQLTEGDITIEFNTDGDKFAINATNSEGSEVYGGNSSGERRRIDICVMFALFRLANEQTNINILLLDEVFDTVDEVGLERIVTMIHGMARELNLTIFVTSHTDLRKWLHESIVVTKQNRMAVLKV